jgi:hypothetical protein
MRLLRIVEGGNIEEGVFANFQSVEESIYLYKFIINSTEQGSF